MKQSLFLPPELDFTLVKFNNTATNIDFEVCSCQISSYCPLCHTINTKIHSRYVRMIGDLPVSGKITKLRFQVRKFFCENLDCSRKIFTEQLNGNMKYETDKDSYFTFVFNQLRWFHNSSNLILHFTYKLWEFTSKYPSQ